MVFLNRIYTRTGDDGTTGLGDGQRVAKTSARVRAGGSVDELNCAIGLVFASELPDGLRKWLRRIQNDLFDLGADVTVPGPDEALEHTPLRITSDRTLQLERWIDALNERLQPLDSFILPGGTAAAACLHHARAVCRRAEIDVLQLAEREQVNRHVVTYLNRLSDFLFVAARVCNNDGNDDRLWRPGTNEHESPGDRKQDE